MSSFCDGILWLGFGEVFGGSLGEVDNLGGRCCFVATVGVVCVLVGGQQIQSKFRTPK